MFAKLPGTQNLLVLSTVIRLHNMKLLVDQGERVRHGLETQVMELQDKLKQAQGSEPAKGALMKVGAPPASASCPS